MHTSLTHFFAALALLCFGALSWHSHAAPVPPAPPRLTEDMLCATWRCAWGGEVGSATFDRDGTYCRWPTRDGDTLCYGTWRIEGNVVELSEYRQHLDLDLYPTGPDTIRVTFDLSQFPHLAGTRDGGGAVLLTRPNP